MLRGDVEKYVAEKINQLCEQNHVSKYRLAQLTGIATSSLTYIQNGKSTPTLHNLDKICDAFNISLAQFFSDESLVNNLSTERRQLLEKWDALSEEEKRYVNIFMRGIEELE